MIEQRVFSRKRFDTDRLKKYGFKCKDDCYILTREFMHGDFTAIMTVKKDGSLQGNVIDNMNDEEYAQLRNPSFCGPYVNLARSEYENLLKDIADKCCIEVAFASDQSNRIAQKVYDKYEVEPDFPWTDGKHNTIGVFRHVISRKWFGLIMNIDRRLLTKSKKLPDKGNIAKEPAVSSDKTVSNDERDGSVDVINLKINEMKKEQLHAMNGIYPAYHMNHNKWISVTLDDTLTDSQIISLIDESYELTKSPGQTMDRQLIQMIFDIADSVPVGKVISYGQIAQMIGRPKNARLVGKVMSLADRYGDHPCHRVVNHAGRTVPGWAEQRPLLEAEGVCFKENGCVDMKKFRLQTYPTLKEE